MTEEEFDSYMAQVRLRFDQCARVNLLRGFVSGALVAGAVFTAAALTVWWWM